MAGKCGERTPCPDRRARRQTHRAGACRFAASRAPRCEPTGLNMFTSDPRTLPTPTAMDLGRLAADEVIGGYRQSHGEMPRALVIDLWGSATLRTGGEEIAQGLALMGCRPNWDLATGRVLGVEVLPCAAIGRPRVDVTWRISGLFRDLFPAQIALLDAAVRAVAARDEFDDENPLASTRSRATPLARIFGTAPGVVRRGRRIADWGRDEPATTIGAAYLAAASHIYGGAGGDGDDCARRVCRARRGCRPADPRQRRSRPRSPRRLRRRRLRRRLFRRGENARAQSRSHHARHDRSAAATRAAAVGRARPGSCAPAPSVPVSSRARCGTARVAPPNLPRLWIAWSISPRTTRGRAERAARSCARCLSGRCAGP